MTTSQTNFYVVGGTLGLDAPSYIPRVADEELFTALRQGKFCHVLTSRQMGKSSLVARTAVRLRNEGTLVATLDLTQVGQNLTAEQWYDGLLFHLGQQLNLDEELDAYWIEHQRLGPMQRFMEAIHEVVLKRHNESIVIFVDEIDAVLGLKFSADEFFAGIRELYNRRVGTPELERLTFCLLGVATPSDLIKKNRTTPFNIGEQIVLTDFTLEETMRLLPGLSCDESLGAKILERIFEWTYGHPYLTQRLCQEWINQFPFDFELREPVLRDQLLLAGAVLLDRLIISRLPPGLGRGLSQYISTYEGRHVHLLVDQLCEEVFLSTAAQKRDTNLIFVRDYLLRDDVDTASLLSLYDQVLKNKLPAADESNPLVSLLRLSGVVWLESGALYVRNPIYAYVFNGKWVSESMPEQEQRRQQAAYRKGLIQASLSTGGLTLAVSIIVMTFLTAINARNAARDWGYKYEAMRKELEQVRDANRLLRNEADVEIKRNIRRAQELQIALEEAQRQLPPPKSTKLKGEKRVERPN